MIRIKVFPVGTPDVAGKVNLVAAFGPVLVCSIVLAMATYVRFSLGRWPIPYDEPNTFVFAGLNWLLIGAIWFLLLSFPIWLGTMPWLFPQRRFRLLIARIILYVLPCAAFVAALDFNTNLANWLLD